MVLYWVLNTTEEALTSTLTPSSAAKCYPGECSSQHIGSKLEDHGPKKKHYVQYQTTHFKFRGLMILTPMSPVSPSLIAKILRSGRSPHGSHGALPPARALHLLHLLHGL